MATKLDDDFDAFMTAAMQKYPLASITPMVRVEEKDLENPDVHAVIFWFRKEDGVLLTAKGQYDRREFMREPS